MSLQSRFVLLYGIGGSFFLALITLLVFISMEREVIERLHRQFEADAKLGIQSIQRNLSQHTEQFQFTASIPMFRAMRFHELTRNTAALRDDIRQLELYFLNQQKTQDDLRAIRYIDAKGVELLRIENHSVARDLADLSWLPEVQNALLLSQNEVSISLNTSEGRVNEMIWWIPVYSSVQSAQGLLSFAFTFDEVQAQLLALVENSQKLVCLVGERNAVLAGNASEQTCLNPDPDHWVVSDNILLPGIQWKIQLSANQDDYLVEIYHLRWLVFGIFFPCVTLLTMLTVYLVSRRLVKPLRQVSWQLKRLAAGNLDISTIQYSGRDEISDLVDSAMRLKTGMESSIAQANAIAGGDYSREVTLLSEHDQLGKALTDMTHKLEDMSNAQATESWLKGSFSKLDEAMRGAQSLEKLSHNVLAMLVKRLNAKVGLFYFYDQHLGKLRLTGSYAYDQTKSEIPREFALGEGLVGQVAEERELMLIGEVPDNYIQIHAGIACIVPRVLIILPLLHEGNIKGVLELGACHAFKDIDLEFLKQASAVIGIELYAAESRTRLEQLLDKKHLDSLY